MTEPKKKFDPAQPVSEPEYLDFAEIAALRIVADLAQNMFIERRHLLEERYLADVVSDVAREIRCAVHNAEPAFIKPILRSF